MVVLAGHEGAGLIAIAQMFERAADLVADGAGDGFLDHLIAGRVRQHVGCVEGIR
jgi:hypothetical protein